MIWRFIHWSFNYHNSEISSGCLRQIWVNSLVQYILPIEGFSSKFNIIPSNSKDIDLIHKTYYSTFNISLKKLYSKSYLEYPSYSKCIHRTLIWRFLYWYFNYHHLCDWQMQWCLRQIRSKLSFISLKFNTISLTRKIIIWFMLLYYLYHSIVACELVAEDLTLRSSSQPWLENIQNFWSNHFM